MIRWYNWIAGVFLLDAVQAFGVIDRIMYGNWEGKGGDKVTQLIALLLFSSAAALYVGSARASAGSHSGSRYPFFLVGYLTLTSLWSYDSSAAIRQATIYLAILFGSIGIARRLSGDEFMRLLSNICFICVVATFAIYIVSPDNAYTPRPDYPDFIGIFPHKNFLGQVMAAGAFASSHNLRTNRQDRLLQLFMLASFIVLGFGSKSTTALLMILLFCSFNVLQVFWRMGGTARTVTKISIIVISPILLAMILNPDPFLEALGKDPTLTGRTEIWAYVEDNIAIKPLFGWGYFGFWTTANPNAVAINDVLQWTVPEAHNGLLEMLINIGFVGTGLFVFQFVQTIRAANRCLHTQHRNLGMSTLIYCAGILVLGVSETVMLAPTQPSTPIFFITTFMCFSAAEEAKRRRGVGFSGQGFTASSSAF